MSNQDDDGRPPDQVHWKGYTGKLPSVYSRIQTIGDSNQGIHVRQILSRKDSEQIGMHIVSGSVRTAIALLWVVTLSILGDVNHNCSEYID